MTDIVPPEVRSRMMAGIQGKNTLPEILVRKEMHRRGYRYRLHASGLPGKPDMVFPRFRAVVFIHGCFWHGHDCALFRLPATRPEFWKDKIDRNRQHDARVTTALLVAGWRVAVIYECTVKRRRQADIAAVVDQLEQWLTGNATSIEIPDSPTGDASGIRNQYAL